jgi:formylglycine-generating enzyme required for sulfatase activity
MRDRNKSFFFIVLCVLAVGPLSLVRADSFEEVTTAVGEEFEINLESNPTTGYSWSLVEHLPDWLELVGMTYVATDPGMVGGGGTEIWTFRATGAGSTTLTFEYERPWEDEPIQVRVYQVTARTQKSDVEGIVFVKIPGGTFEMGDIDWSGSAEERPVHTVTLRDFEMSKYETTNAQYAAYLNEALARGAVRVVWGTVYASDDGTLAHPYFDTVSANSYSQIEYSQGRFSVRSRNGQSMADHPVVQVSWYGAKAFCDYYGCRLPTEAEWEYAARGGPDSPYARYPWGGNTLDCSKANCNTITYCNPVGLITYPYTSPVGYYGPQGAYGLCDMCGNVWEFCADWYSATYYSFSPAANPSGPFAGKMRVVRGGSWDEGEYRVSWHTPTGRTWDGGFRVCR